MLRISVNSCRSLLRLNFAKSNNTCRSIHVVCRVRQSTLKNAHTLKSHFDSHILSAFFVRHASTNDTTVDGTKEPEVIRIDLTDHKDQLPDIPDAPAPLEITEILQKLHANGEVAFESLGLGGHSPVGLIQYAMEWLHISGNVPWWGAIAIATLTFRILIFPLVISTQRHAATMNVFLPKIAEIQQKLTEARLSGDHYEAALYANQLYKLMKDRGVGPWKSFRTIIIQAPLFLSFFMALRGMANLPVESLKTGGLWWFTDLTVPDPYYILPLITCLTLLVTIELGTEGVPAQSLGKMKYVMRCVPLVVLPASIGFPSAICFYWTTTNFLSLMQVGFLRIPAVREKLKLPLKIKPKPNPEQLPKKGFVKGFKDSWDNIKITKQLANRDASDSIQFDRAARTPIIKTYKYDPTKQTDKPAAILTKKQ